MYDSSALSLSLSFVISLDGYSLQDQHAFHSSIGVWRPAYEPFDGVGGTIVCRMTSRSRCLDVSLSRCLVVSMSRCFGVSIRWAMSEGGECQLGVQNIDTMAKKRIIVARNLKT